MCHAQLAEIRRLGTILAHDIICQKSEAAVRTSGAIRVDSVARELTEIGDTLTKRVDMIGIATDACDDIRIAQLYRPRGPAQLQDR